MEGIPEWWGGEKEDDCDDDNSRWRKQSTSDRTLGSQRKKGIKEEL